MILSETFVVLVVSILLNLIYISMTNKGKCFICLLAIPFPSVKCLVQVYLLSVLSITLSFFFKWIYVFLFFVFLVLAVVKHVVVIVSICGLLFHFHQKLNVSS